MLERKERDIHKGCPKKLVVGNHSRNYIDNWYDLIKIVIYIYEIEIL